MVTKASGLWRVKKLNKKRQKVIDVDIWQGIVFGNNRGGRGVPVDRILAVVTNVAGDGAIVAGGQTTQLGEVLVQNCKRCVQKY